MKTFVLTVNPRFEKPILDTIDAVKHGRTLPAAIKRHTIRANYGFWERRIAAITRGEAVLSIRVWSGKPYLSPQREFLRLEKVGLQKLAKRSDGANVSYHITNGNGLGFISTATLAQGDGLSYDDFQTWFRDYPDGDMALIHFTDFRY
jgi:hypothetical protein